VNSDCTGIPVRDMIGPCEETQTSEPKKNLTEDRSNNTRRKLEGPLHQSQIVKIPNAEKNHLRQPKQNRNPASLSDVVMTIVGQIDDEHDQQRKDDHIPHPEEVETLMVQEMNAMTVDQRERAYEAIHGVGEAVEESDEFVDKCLEEMGNSIQRINPKGSYIRAEQQSRSYVHDRRLRLKFLRAENFNPLEAARRLIRFFEGISKYFGPSCLTRPLRLDDLDHDDLSALKSGHLQLFSDRDSAGRVVLGDFQAMERCAYKKVDNMVRAFIYVLTCAAYDDESQKKGIVTLIYQINSPPDARVDTEMAMEGPQVFRWMPLKITAHHMCLDDPFYKQMARFVLAAAGKDFRSHYRLHEGSMTEVRYSLMSFGLPVGSNFPISPEGFIRKEAHARWLATRRAMESELEKDGSFAGIDIPRRQDVRIFLLLLGFIRTRRETYTDEEMRETNTRLIEFRTRRSL
jgi:hypothetical protein